MVVVPPRLPNQEEEGHARNRRCCCRETGGQHRDQAQQLQQLFNSLDPSPFHDRDLDQDAEDYIIDSADEFSLQTPLSLIVYLPADQLSPVEGPDLTRAIHNYFAYRLRENRRRLRLFFRDGRVALVIGLAFLFVCTVLRQVVLAARQGAMSEIVAEGLLIVG